MTVLEQVKQDGLFLKYVKNQTPELCIEAVKGSGMALQYVKRQTPEICLAAVQQNSEALQYVKDQTPEICLAAVRQNGLALEFVKDKTTEICMEAMKQMSKNKLQRFVLRLSHIDQTPENNMASVAAVREMLNGRRPKFTWQLLKIMNFLAYLWEPVPPNPYLNFQAAASFWQLWHIGP